jgi:hypothetical protein
MKYGPSLAISRPRRPLGGVSTPQPSEISETNLVAHLFPMGSGHTVNGSDRVTVANNLGSGDDPTGGASTGPVQMTDAAGNTFWRFNGSTNFLSLSTNYSFNSRELSVFFVGRMYTGGTVATIMSMDTNTLRPMFGSGTNGATSHHISAQQKYGYNATNPEYFTTGQQLQVCGMASRADSLRLMSNTEAENMSASPSYTASGGEIGRDANIGSRYGYFDLYEMAIYAGAELTDGEADAVISAMKTRWSIADLTNRIIIEGDSIHDGVGDIADHENPGAALSEPGGDYELPGWLVHTLATSGATVSTLVTRRDSTTCPVSYSHLSGRNIYAFQIGRNDFDGLAGTGTSVVDTDIVALLNTTTTGVLQRGWEVFALTNIGTGASLQVNVEEARTEMESAGFLVDCDAEPSTGTYDGMLTVVPVEDHEVAGSGTIFDTTADSADTTWYQNDSTHPNAAGSEQLGRLIEEAITA